MKIRSNYNKSKVEKRHNEYSSIFDLSVLAQATKLCLKFLNSWLLLSVKSNRIHLTLKRHKLTFPGYLAKKEN